MLTLISQVAAFAILFVFCYRCGRRQRKPLRRYPVAGDNLQYYDRDYVILSESIDKAVTLRQIDYALSFIHDFKKRYHQHQEYVELKIDFSNLLDKCGKRRRAIINKTLVEKTAFPVQFEELLKNLN